MQTPPGAASVCRRGDVHAVAVDVVALDREIAEMNADAELHRAAPAGAIRVLEILLDLDGALHAFDDAPEDGEHAVPGEIDDAAGVALGPIRDAPLRVLERGDGRALVARHQAGVTDDVGAQHRRQTPLEGRVLGVGRRPCNPVSRLGHVVLQKARPDIEAPWVGRRSDVYHRRPSVPTRPSTAVGSVVPGPAARGSGPFGPRL
jgi:hypothetical protein